MPHTLRMPLGRSTFVALCEAVVRSGALSQVLPLLARIRAYVQSHTLPALSAEECVGGVERDPTPQPSVAAPAPNHMMSAGGGGGGLKRGAERDPKAAADMELRWPEPVLYYVLLRVLGESNSGLCQCM
jgi:hypothetical protein